jgi:hypothetical protein
VAYDQELADRIRQLIGDEPDLPLVAATTATVVEMRGRLMPGWLRVSSADLRTDEQLLPWLERGTGYARSLPPKS